MERLIGKLSILLIYVIGWIVGFLIDLIYRAITKDYLSEKTITILSVLGALPLVVFIFQYKSTGDVTDYLVWISPLLVFFGLLRGLTFRD